MTGQRARRLTEQLAGQEPPEWIEQLERMVAVDPKMTLPVAAEWVGRNTVTISCWLRATGHDDLLLRLRWGKSPADWAWLAEEALAAEPGLTLEGFAERYGRKPMWIERALTKARRSDLVHRLQHLEVEHSHLQRSEPRMPGWGAVVEAVLIADPTLTLDGLAWRIGHHPDLIAEELTRAGRQDLLRQLDRNDDRGHRDVGRVA